MAEWYADVKPSGKAFVPEEPAEEADDVLGSEMVGDLTVKEIAQLSRSGYTRYVCSDPAAPHLLGPSSRAREPRLPRDSAFWWGSPL